MPIEILENNGIVFNYDMILSNISDRIGKYMSEIELEGYLKSGIEIFYYNHDSDSYDKKTNIEEGSLLKVIVTQIVDKRSGTPLCLSYFRDSLNNWRGCIVGTMFFVHKRFYNRYMESLGVINDRVSKKEINQNNKEKNLETIYENLYYKESWKSEKDNLKRLDDYIRALKRKIENENNKGNKDYLVFNKTGMKVIFNSRLLDKYGNYINLMASYKSGSLSDIELLDGVKMLKDNNFDAMILNIKPVEFFDTLEQVVFKGDMSEFDFTNTYALHHVVCERRYRFPDFVKNKNEIEIVNSLKVAVEHGLKMSRVDYKFVVPMYNLEHDKIQFLMPIYFTFGEDESPHMALVIERYNGFWNIKTILTIEDAYVNARVISNPDVKWLRIGLN